MKVISVIAGREHLVKCFALNGQLQKHGIEHILLDIAVYDHAFASETYRQLNLPIPTNTHFFNFTSQKFSDNYTIQKNLINAFNKINPNVVLIYGDVYHSVIAAYASLISRIPIAHIEAGLRNWDINDREELYRTFIDHVSDSLFVTSDLSKKNLIDEGISKNKIFIAGNSIISALKENIDYAKPDIIEEKDLHTPYILTTLHRIENLRSRQSIFNYLSAIIHLAKSYKIILILYRTTRHYFKKFDVNSLISSNKNIVILETIPYFQYIGLLKECSLIITDSSGIQDEAAYLGKPCVICRKRTHREGIIGSTSQILAGTNSKSIIDNALRFLLSENKPSSSYPNSWNDNIGNMVSSILLSRYRGKTRD